MIKEPTAEQLGQRIKELEKEAAGRRHAEQALQESEQRYRILTEHVADGVVLLQAGRILFVNNAFVSMFDYTDPGELIGKQLSVLVSDDFKKRFQQVCDHLEAGVTSESVFQGLCLSRHGQDFWVEVHNNTIEWNGSPAVLATVKGITEAEEEETVVREQVKDPRREDTRLMFSIKDRDKFGDIIDKSPATPQSVDTDSTSAASLNHQGLILREALHAFEKEFISKALEQNQWHRARTATMLGIPERTLYRKLRQFRPT